MIAVFSLTKKMDAKATTPRNWPEGRLKSKIESARSGDDAAGRELLGTAAMQLREHDDFEPDLRRYLEQILFDLTRAREADIGKVLNIAAVCNPPYRPIDSNRLKHMVLAWKMACDTPTIDQGDIDNISVTAKKITDLEDEWEQYAQSVDLIEYLNEAESSERRFPTKAETYRLAATLFNHLLEDAQTNGQRIGEKKIKWTAIKAAVNRKKKRKSDGNVDVYDELKVNASS